MTQFFSRTGMISLLKSGARCANAGIAITLSAIPKRTQDGRNLVPSSDIRRLPIGTYISHLTTAAVNRQVSKRLLRAVTGLFLPIFGDLRRFRDFLFDTTVEWCRIPTAKRLLF